MMPANQKKTRTGNRRTTYKEWAKNNKRPGKQQQIRSWEKVMNQCTEALGLKSNYAKVVE
ncbi:MAG: hypothetical protein JNM22_09625 [Saprospiraceae bacterium]|nr:hypothetical protein [Saprospiraceae bacterium]